MTLPLGLHFGLPAEQHHQDHGLGSSSVKQLAENAYQWWWNSWMNPDRPEDDDDTASRINGRALHLLLYEGESEFAKHFICGPDQRGMSTTEKSNSTRAANKLAAGSGRECLKRDAYQRILMAHKMITVNPDLATVFTGGMPEVTFVWEKMVDGMPVRCKARFDYLKPVIKKDAAVIAIGDLKSVANQYGLDFKRACRQAVGTYRYHAQAAHYLEAAALVPAAIKAGQVHTHGRIPIDVASTLENPDSYLTRLAAAKYVAWQWIFFQSTGAPLTFSYYLSPGNPLLQEGRDIVDRALSAYVSNMKKYKLGEQWLMMEKPEELAIEEMGWRS